MALGCTACSDVITSGNVTVSSDVPWCLFKAKIPATRNHNIILHRRHLGYMKGGEGRGDSKHGDLVAQCIPLIRGLPLITYACYLNSLPPPLFLHVMHNRTILEV